MYAELYNYLILNKELPVPGIGTFLLKRHPAEADFPNKTIHSPSFSISLEQTENTPSIKFFKWLSQSLAISDHEAITRFNDFVFGMKKQIAEGSTIQWDGVGVLTKSLSGGIRFEPEKKTYSGEPVHAEKIIREKAEHMVRVGEDEKTSEEMTTFLNQTEEKRSYGWAAALILGLLSVMFLGWYFSENGVKIASTANSKKIVPGETPPTYYLLP